MPMKEVRLGDSTVKRFAKTLYGQLLSQIASATNNLKIAEAELLSFDARARETGIRRLHAVNAHLTLLIAQELDWMEGRGAT